MKFKNYFKILFIGVSLIFLNGFETYSQQIYATTATEISEGNLVENSANAEAENGLFAIVNSNVSSSGELKLEFPITIPANSTTYIKVDDLEKGLYDALLGGSLGDLLADAAGTAALGDHYVEVSALDTTGEVVALGSTNNLFNDSTIPTNTTVPLKVVKNKDGALFITITPTVAYKAIVIKDITDSTLIATPNFTNVYHAFYLDPTDTSCNSEEIFTSFDGTGVTLDLLDLGATGVKDLEFAIDNDPITFSTISVGVLSAEASMYQDIYFSTTATNEDILELNIRPKGGAIVNAAYEQNITVALYKEDAVVFSQTLDGSDQITIDPSEDGEIINITVTPKVEFDRLRVTLTSPAGFNLDQQVDLFSVKVTPPPTTAPNPQYFCAVNNPTIADLEAAGSGTFIWYDKATGGTAFEAADTLELDLENNKKYYASNLVGTCESIERAEVTVIITDPEKPEGDPNQSFCVIDEPKIENLIATAAAPGTIIWYDKETEGTAYADNTALEDDLKYYAANSDGTCESSERLEVTVTIRDPEKPEGDPNQTFCSTEAAKIVDLEATATGTIIWYDQPTNGTAYANNNVLTNGFIYYAANSDGSCESSERLKVTVVITTAQDISIEGKNTNICFADVETYRVPDGHAPYTWNIAGGNLVSGGMADDNEIEVEWINITSAKVSVSLTGGCYTSNSAEQIIEVVVCSDLTIKKEVDFIKPTVEDIITFTINVKNSDKSVFKNVIISEVLPSGFTYESYTTSLGIYTPSNEIWNIPTLGANGSATLTLTVKVNTTGDYLNRASIIQSTPTDKDTSNNTAEALVTPSCLKIYNIITPNGDGLNDNFVISCVKDADIEIYDRYGSIVYKNQNYNNDWNGVANQRGKIIGKGEKLPNGTYFFVLRFNDGSIENIKSYIQIIR
ncbi:MAG: gliding motility-associated-like protein/uncharacterized repeat protein (TIGR01451 family) [Polaribacter sp.]|jgi:gliding motility-associated-like protein/uncharacterized repeat protein (TIGR01451 family)|tara:strand:- start:1509 stop:4232 length:2724 start_codon:yes stop_codon:yes gene_type:complete